MEPTVNPMALTRNSLGGKAERTSLYFHSFLPLLSMFFSLRFESRVEEFLMGITEELRQIKVRSRLLSLLLWLLPLFLLKLI